MAWGGVVGTEDIAARGSSVLALTAHAARSAADHWAFAGDAACGKFDIRNADFDDSQLVQTERDSVDALLLDRWEVPV